jgi:hypothetical protein
MAAKLAFADRSDSVSFMRRRLPFVALLLAWLSTQGAFLELAQVFAWSRMFAGYAQSMSWRQALVETLDPEKPCAMCCAIRRARATEPPQPAAPAPSQEGAKLVLFLLAGEGPLIPPVLAHDWYERVQKFVDWQLPVPTPPPRFAVVV